MPHKEQRNVDRASDQFRHGASRTAASRSIDLTQTLKPSTPVIQLPPPFAQSDPFRISEISHYDERGPAWYWNNLSMGEHTGTHFDAPCHWVTGKDNPTGYTDTVPVQRLVAPAVVIDCSKEAAADEKFLLEPAHIEVWEGKHGRIPDGAWVLMRTDWSKRDDPARFLNMKEDGPHSPGPSAAAVKFLIEQRNVNGWGVEAVGTDHGQAFAFEPAFPAHHLMHGANKFGLASLTQPRPVAADRRRADHAAAQDREGLGQPAARAGAGCRRRPSDFASAAQQPGIAVEKSRPSTYTRRTSHAPG